MEKKITEKELKFLEEKFKDYWVPDEEEFLKNYQKFLEEKEWSKKVLKNFFGFFLNLFENIGEGVIFIIKSIFKIFIFSIFSILGFLGLIIYRFLYIFHYGFENFWIWIKNNFKKTEWGLKKYQKDFYQKKLEKINLKIGEIRKEIEENKNKIKGLKKEYQKEKRKLAKIRNENKNKLKEIEKEILNLKNENKILEKEAENKLKEKNEIIDKKEDETRIKNQEKNDEKNIGEFSRKNKKININWFVLSLVLSILFFLFSWFYLLSVFNL